jgi:hypothetical protein
MTAIEIVQRVDRPRMRFGDFRRQQRRRLLQTPQCLVHTPRQGVEALQPLAGVSGQTFVHRLQGAAHLRQPHRHGLLIESQRRA